MYRMIMKNKIPFNRFDVSLMVFEILFLYFMNFFILDVQQSFQKSENHEYSSVFDYDEKTGDFF